MVPKDAHPSQDYTESGLLPARDLRVEGGEWQNPSGQSAGRDEKVAVRTICYHL